MTAVELATVLVLVAILGFASYSALSNVRETLLVKGAAEQTAGAVRLARQLAITPGREPLHRVRPGRHAIPVWSGGKGMNVEP